MTNVGIVGTGMLGEAVGLHLLDVGYEVTVFNRTKEKTKKLEDKGAKVVDSPKQVAENSDLIIIVVRDAEAVNDVIFGDLGIILGKHDRICIADMSTVNPNSTKEISEKVTEHKVDYIEIPVTVTRSDCEAYGSGSGYTPNDVKPNSAVGRNLGGSGECDKFFIGRIY